MVAKKKSEDTIRLSVSVDKELNDKIEFWANKLYMSKNQLIVTIVAQQIDNFGLTFEMFKNPQWVNAMKEAYNAYGKATGANIEDELFVLDNASTVVEKIESNNNDDNKQQ